MKKFNFNNAWNILTLVTIGFVIIFFSILVYYRHQDEKSLNDLHELINK